MLPGIMPVIASAQLPRFIAHETYSGAGTKTPTYPDAQEGDIAILVSQTYTALSQTGWTQFAGETLMVNSANPMWVIWRQLTSGELASPSSLTPDGANVNDGQLAIAIYRGVTTLTSKGIVNNGAPALPGFVKSGASKVVIGIVGSLVTTVTGTPAGWGVDVNSNNASNRRALIMSVPSILYDGNAASVTLAGTYPVSTAARIIEAT